jgi:hypothetical protein
MKLQRNIKVEDYRAIFVLIIAGMIVSVAWFFNATIVYDDIFFPDYLSGLVTELGWFKAFIKLFCLDMPNEYRTYGLSRVIQFMLWSLGGASVSAYTLFISLSQLITVLVLYALLVCFRVDRIIALALGLMWLFSPFIWTSCFHHYSYLILPAQLTIIACYFLTMVTEAKPQKILSIFLGIALALTGELHLVPATLILIFVAVVVNTKIVWRATILLIATMMLTVIAHFSIWKIFVSTNTSKARFSLNLTYDSNYYKENISIGIKGVWRSIIEQLSEIGGTDTLWFMSITLLSSLLIFLILGWVLAKVKSQEKNISNRSLLYLATIFIFVSFIYLIVEICIAAIAGHPANLLPRRYGYIPLTILFSATALYITVLANNRFGKTLTLSVVLGLMITLFIRHQFIILPATIAADERLSKMISNELKLAPTKTVLFFRASDSIFPKKSFDAGIIGPAMRGVTSEEVSQAKYSSYLVAAFMNVSKALGASLTCVLGGLEVGKLKVVCPPWEKNPGTIPLSAAIIVANLGFNELDPFGEQVQVFQNFVDFEPYFFAKEIIRNINWQEMSGSDVVAVDLGLITSNVVINDTLPDKRFNASTEKSAKDWLLNYGYKKGDDSVYKLPNLSISEYYRSNRNGSFEYRFEFLESDLTIDLDFCELWVDKPKQRLFSIGVSWNDGPWVPLGEIDPALINGNKPFSVRLVHQNTRSFAFRLSPVQGSKDIPFIQGVRIARKPTNSKPN